MNKSIHLFLCLIALLSIAPIFAMEDEAFLINDDDQCETSIPVTFYFGESSKRSLDEDEPTVIEGRNIDAQLMAALKNDVNAQNRMGRYIWTSGGFYIGPLKPIIDDSYWPKRVAEEFVKLVKQTRAPNTTVITTNSEDWKRTQETIERLDQSSLQMPTIEDVD